MSNKVTKQIRVKTDATMTGDGTINNPLHSKSVAGGDMLLGTAQTVIAAKTFNTGTLISPDITGGTAVDSNIIYKSTTGVGTTIGIAHQWTGGNNGGTTIATMLNNGNVGIGTTSPVVRLTVKQGTSEYAQLSGVTDMALGIATDTALIGGVDFKNFNSAGSVRFMARNDQDDYLVMNAPGSAVATTYFGIAGSATNLLFSLGSTNTTKKLTIGTYNAGDLILGTNII